MEIGFNSKYLLEMLNNMDAAMITIELSQPNRAGVILPAEQDAEEDILMLIMPMMLNNY
jgi:DNA polymerase-3 subunit beta